MAQRIRARVFGEVADEYERVRPGYPPALVDDVLAYAGPAGRPALEVGAGTGKATVAFAGRGVPVTALEPDPAMAAVLARRTGGVPGVSVVPCAFEAYRPDRRYGLLYSAQAWHWTDPVRRWRLAAEALAPGGALALFWNGDAFADPALAAAVAAAHEPFAADLPERVDTCLGPRDDWPADELAACPDFGDLDRRAYPWERELPAADYLALLGTQSAYRMLAGPVRRRLFGAVGALLGERVVLSLRTELYLARRRDQTCDLQVT